MNKEYFEAITANKKNESAIGRFETVAQLYIEGTDEMRNTILCFFTGEERTVFLEAVGMFKLFTDGWLYKAVEEAMCEVIYAEAHQ